MMKHLLTLLAALTVAQTAHAAGRIQNEDVKSQSDIQSAAGSITGNLTSGSACVTSPSSVTGLSAGMYAYDTTHSAYIPSGTTIVAIPGTCSAGQIQLSLVAAGTATGDSLTFGGQVSQLINDSKLYVSANGINSRLDQAITNGLLGGAGGSKNYLANGVVPSTSSGVANPGNGDLEKGSTVGWNLAHSAISSNIPTTVGSAGVAFAGTSAAGTLSLGVTNSGQLQKNYSMNYSSSGASTAGDMVISSAFGIDSADQAKMMQVKFYYKANSGSANLNFSGTSANSFSIWIYDVTNAAWIQPAGTYNLVQSAGVGYAVATFQTTSNSTQYQLAVINNSASAGAFAMYMDDFSVGPQIAPTGAAITDWVAYTPTFIGMGTVSGPSFFSRRVGDSLQVHGLFTYGTGTGVATQITIGYAGSNGNVQIDSSKVTLNTKVGDAVTANFSSSYFRHAILGPPGSANPANYVQMSVQTTSTAAASGSVLGNSQNIASGNAVEVDFMVPIVGWSSNTAMSNDTDTRVTSFSVNAVTPSSSPTGSTTVTWGSATTDTHGGWNGSTSYTIPVTGMWECSVDTILSSAASTNASWSIAVNATSQTICNASSATGSTAVVRFPARCSGVASLKAGEVVTVNGSNSGISSPTWQGASNSFSCKRISGPAVVAASESVGMSYLDGSSGAVGTSPALYNFTSKQFDSHNAYSGGLYTCPVNGKYRVSTGMSLNGVALSTTQAFTLQIYVNGNPQFATSTKGNGGGSSVGYSATLSGTVNCQAGGTIGVYPSVSVASTALASSNYNWLSIERVGN